MKNRKLLRLFLIFILLGGSAFAKTPKDDNKTVETEKIDKNIVLSINGINYKKEDFPKIYTSLKYKEKKEFLSKYLYYKVVLDSLTNEQKKYKKEITKSLLEKKHELEKKGIQLDEIGKIILTYTLTLNTIAHEEVLKEHKDIDNQVKQFYKKHEKEFHYPDAVEVAHISLKSKKEAKDIIKKLNDKNITIERFSIFAKKYSLDIKTKFMGGYIGKIGKKQVNKDFFDILWKTKNNSLVQTPLEKEGYYHIIYVLKKHNSTQKTLKEEKSSIINFLLKKEIKKWKAMKFKKANKETTVKVYDIKI